MKAHVVISDPSGEYWEGGLVTPELAKVLEARKVLTLPLEQEFVGRSALGGWVKRSWGAGVDLSGALPHMNAPLILYVTKDDGLCDMHWIARLVPKQPNSDVKQFFEDGGRFSGTLRIAGNTGQPGCFAGGLSSTSIFDAKSLGAPDEEGGWTVTGSALLNVGIDCMWAASFYGAIDGMRMAWAALSQARR